jgi:glycosyltransferase involved in cell wall biosynthesis
MVEESLRSCSSIAPDRSILYLGRIHPVKGVDLLLEAFARFSARRDWRIALAGPADDSAYVRRLSALAEKLGIERLIDWLGPVYGREKFALIQRSWVICVPSHTEVIGMVNLEAAACRVPTVTTEATGLTQWSEHGGFLADATIASLSERLARALTMSAEERAQRGEMLRRLVETQYSSAVVKERWQELYAGAIERARRRSKAPPH